MTNHVIRTNRFGDFMTILGRILIAGVFLMAGVSKIVGFSQVKAQMISIGIPIASFFLVLALILEIVGGLFLLFGYQTKITAFLLAGFVLILNPIMHNPIYADQMVLFLKNLMIIGGLLFISAFGAGRISVDHKVLKNY